MKRARRIVINADDFGICSETTDSIVECYRLGAITSTTLVVGGVDAQRAVDLAKKYNIPVGLHLNLTYGYPISDPSLVPSLFGPDGRLDVRLKHRLTRFQPAISEVQLEIQNQIKRFQGYGLVMTHMDSHHGIHTHFIVLAVLIGLRKQIAKIRPPRNWEAAGALRSHEVGRFFYRKVYELIANRYFRCPEYFTGISDYHANFDHSNGLAALSDPPKATIEIMCHPGFTNDYSVLTSSEWLNLVARNKNCLINYNQV
jgi:predicted glycoside hydrolase/deacetylase ChbG (UPF0249 family)